MENNWKATDLTAALEHATNVKSVTYDTKLGKWIVRYKRKGYTPDIVSHGTLIDHLLNA